MIPSVEYPIVFAMFIILPPDKNAWQKACHAKIQGITGERGWLPVEIFNNR
jgi:hypothetical protein